MQCLWNNLSETLNLAVWGESGDGLCLPSSLNHLTGSLANIHLPDTSPNTSEYLQTCSCYQYALLLENKTTDLKNICPFPQRVGGSDWPDADDEYCSFSSCWYKISLFCGSGTWVWDLGDSAAACLQREITEMTPITLVSGHRNLHLQESKYINQPKKRFLTNITTAGIIFRS